MLKFYYSLAPNPMKVALFLEKAGLPFGAIPVDTRKGEQHAAADSRPDPVMQRASRLRHAHNAAQATNAAVTSSRHASRWARSAALCR